MENSTETHPNGLHTHILPSLPYKAPFRAYFLYYYCSLLQRRRPLAPLSRMCMDGAGGYHSVIFSACRLVIFTLLPPIFSLLIFLFPPPSSTLRANHIAGLPRTSLIVISHPPRLPSPLKSVLTSKPHIRLPFILPSIHPLSLPTP